MKGEAVPVSVPLVGDGVIVQFAGDDTFTVVTLTTADGSRPTPLRLQLTVPFVEVGTVIGFGVQLRAKLALVTPT